MRIPVVVVSLLAAILGQEPQLQLRPEWSVVLPEGQARTFWKPMLCNRPTPSPIEGIGIPENATIRRLETALAPALQKAIETSTIRGTRPAVSDFYRQYVGFVVAGQRIVYINGFHKLIVEPIPGRPTPWRTEAQHPCDGGMLFFGAEFRVDSGAIERLANVDLKVLEQLVTRSVADTKRRYPLEA